MAYALLAAIPLTLWVASRPFSSVLVIAVVAGLVVGARRATAVIRCFYECEGVAFDLAGTARITVRQVNADESC